MSSGHQSNGGAQNGNGSQPTLTTRQGHPVTDNQSLRTVGERGPTTFENYHFIEKITHFDRERIQCARLEAGAVSFEEIAAALVEQRGRHLTSRAVVHANE